MYALNDPIECLNLSTRSYNCLRRNRIDLISQLIVLSENDLYKLNNMGKKSVDEVLEVISILSKQELSEVSIGKTENPRFILNYLVSELNLSTRSENCLVRNGVETVDEMIWLSMEKIEKFNNLGVKSFNEICLKIKDIEQTIKSEKEQIALNKILPIWILKAIEETCVYFDINYSKSCSMWLNAFKKIKGDNVFEIVNQLSFDDRFVSLLEKKILSTSTNWRDEFSIEKVTQKLPSCMKNTDILQNAFKKCEADGKILSLEDGMYFFKHMSVVEFADTISDERTKEIINGRLSGKTLNEVGEIYGMSRERTRQICEKVFLHHPKLKEDKYIDLFGIYEIEMDDFLYIFDEKPSTYYYLKMTSNITKQEKLPLKMMLYDSSISNEVKKKIESIVYKNYIYDNGKYIIKQRPEVFKHYFIHNCIKKTAMNEILDGYCEFLKKHNVFDDEKLQIDSRTYDNKLNTCDYALANIGKAYRYYDVANEENDYDLLVSELAISEYIDKEISTLKLFREHLDLMELYDVHDEYELHNLLRKIWDKYGSCKVEFTKMPTIRVGTSDEKQQMLEFIIQNSPILANDIANLYEEAYGVKSALALTKFLEYHGIYYHKGWFKVDYESMSEEQFDYMKSNLTEDFYSINEVKRMFVMAFPNASNTLINSHNIKLLDFGVYSNYILKKEYTATSYAEKLLTENDVFNIDDFPKDFLTVVIFGTVLYEKKKNREIIEFAPHRYLNIKRLEKIGITKSDLEEYCNAVAKCVDEGEYFTVESLKNSGFSHNLDDLDFEEWFYSSIIIEDTPRFSYKRAGGTKILYRGEKSISTPDFFEYILEKLTSIDIYDFEMLLKETYGINMSHTTILETIKKTNLYYDAIMEKVYVDYNTYFEEI